MGINVTYQTAQQTTTGIIAPALTFNFTAPALPQNNYFNGPTGISFTLGRSAASVTLHPVLGAGGSASGGTGLPVGGSTGGGIGGIGSGTGTTPPVGGVGGALPSLGGSIPSVVPGGTSSSGVPNASGSGGGTTTPRLNPVALVDTSQADLSGVYLVAVAVAGVALAAASILRLLGVRLLWGS